MGFLVLAKHGLRRDVGFKTKFGLQREKKKTMKAKKKGEKKRKRKRKRREDKERKIKGMETNLEYGF